MKKSPGLILLVAILAAAMLAPPVASADEKAAQREYAQRRARLLEQLAAPVVLFGYAAEDFGLADPERKSPQTTFRQEENFYYLTGVRQEGAALLLVPLTPAAKAAGLAGETLYLPPRDRRREHWDGVRLGPDDPEAAEQTGVAQVKTTAALRGDLEKAATLFPEFYALFPPPGAEPARTHAGRWLAWLKELLPHTGVQNVRGTIGAMRQVKSESEQALLRTSIERTLEAHREALRAMRPGMYEYEIASLMTYTFERAGCERPAYPPIVGSGPNSTVLHHADPRRQMQAGEVVVIDVGAECAGYPADITRTLPTSGKFTARQREIYEIVLGAQNAAIAAVKPGMTMARTGENSLYRIAYDYINTHGKDLKGEPLGKYFTHGLGHHVGLQVHDAGDPNRPLEPGMIVTIEPGIYIPEENLGVRIEDMVLVTEKGAVLLSGSLPRTVDDVERVMAVEGTASISGLCVVSMPPLGYPPLARLARIQGKVQVDVEIDPSGRVRRATARGGHPLLQKYAREGLERWVFGCLGIPERFPVLHTVDLAFKIEGEPAGTRVWKVNFDLPAGAEIVTNPPLPTRSD
ncbi:MAG TPA: aminopeptidase P N-terminal domain-containing protein [Candidatus Xenobia bacterium]|nr:aminopeptidase P N-terminal domain-containing protein [Candidatus Xenobia bacterium]